MLQQFGVGGFFWENDLMRVRRGISIQLNSSGDPFPGSAVDPVRSTRSSGPLMAPT